MSVSRGAPLIWIAPAVWPGKGRGELLLAQVVSEVGDGVLGVADKLGLGLGTVVFFAINVGEDGGDLAVYGRRM